MWFLVSVIVIGLALVISNILLWDRVAELRKDVERLHFENLSLRNNKWH